MQLDGLGVEYQADDVVYINKSSTYADNIDTIERKTALLGNALTGEAIGGLLAHFEAVTSVKYTQQGAAGLTRQRHADCVRKALSAAQRAMENLGHAPELASDDIRMALQALEELAGSSDIEQVFDRIFSRFCIGK